MKKKKIFTCVLAAMTMLAIAGMGTGCAVKDWFDEKINSQEEPVLIPELYAYANGTKITSADIYADGVLSFEVVVNNYEDATAEVVITSSPEGAEASVEELDGEWTFYPDGVGEYVITITSLVNDALTATITVNVKECPAIETILDGKKYQNKGKSETNDLTIQFDYKQKMTLATFVGEIYNADDQLESVKLIAMYKFTYDEETKEFMLEAVTLQEAQVQQIYPGYIQDATLLNSITLNVDYTLSVVYCNSNKQAVLETYVEEEQTESEVDTSSESEVSTESEIDESISSLDE